MGKVIKVSYEVAKKLDELRHTGQSYDGLLREILEKVKELENWQKQRK